MAREQISVSIDSQVLALVERYRSAQQVQISRSQAIEALIRAGLHGGSQMSLSLGFDGPPPAPSNAVPVKPQQPSKPHRRKQTS
jgi:hypothetical protein